MTTVWEPDLDELRASVAEMEGSGERRGGGRVEQGDEAEEEPLTRRGHASTG